MSNEKNFQCMIPTIPKDYLGIRSNIYQIPNKLPIREMVFIGPSSLREIILEDAKIYGSHTQVSFIAENDLLPFAQIQNAYQKRARELTIDHEKSTFSGMGWYYQQFLKMAYCKICPDEYYLCFLTSNSFTTQKIGPY